MELLLILIMALIVFGPGKLPEVMGQVGKAIRDFRRTTTELSEEFNRTIQAELAETKAVVDETKALIQDVRSAATLELPPPRPTPAPELVAAPPPAGPAAEASNGASTTNGTVEAAPAVVDTTSAWHWETAPAEPPPASPPAEPTSSATPERRSEKARAADDDLLPPY